MRWSPTSLTRSLAVPAAALAALVSVDGAARAGIIVTIGDEPLWLQRARVVKADDEAACADEGEGDGEGDEGDDGPRAHRHAGHGGAGGKVEGGRDGAHACRDDVDWGVVDCPPWGPGAAGGAPPGAWGCHQLEPGVYWCELPGGARSEAVDGGVEALGCGGGAAAGGLSIGLAGLGLAGLRLSRRRRG